MKKVEIKQEKVLGDNHRIYLLNSKIDVLTMNETVDLVEKYIEKNEPLHLIGVNADKINQMDKNDYLKKIVNSCGIINADGASVVLASRFLGQPIPERVSGIDLMNLLVKRCELRNYKIFLLGAKDSVVKKTVREITDSYPNINICGYHDGYFSENDWGNISEILFKSQPDIVFVGITSPIKEYLVEFLQDMGHSCVFMGVGGSFDVISGKIKRAPKWIQRLNLEWLYRMAQEPKRLGKRYLKGNLEFIVKVLSSKKKKN